MSLLMIFGRIIASLKLSTQDHKVQVLNLQYDDYTVIRAKYAVGMFAYWGGHGCAAFVNGDQDRLAACDATATRIRAQRTDVQTTIASKSSIFVCVRGNVHVYTF